MKKKNLVLFAAFSLWYLGHCIGQEMNVVNIASPTGLGLINLEPVTYGYDFKAPLASSLLCKNGYQNTPPPGEPLSEGAFCSDPKLYTPTPPSSGNRYFMSVFGPRMQANSGAINSVYDFHRGEDAVNGAEPASGGTMPDILCMCDGIVYKIFDEADLAPGQNIEQTETGRYVTVKCNATFSNNPTMGNVYTAYRHLSTINTALAENAAISRGTLIGTMGSSGITTVTHLHLSAQKMVNNKLINVHPMRLFNATYNRHLLVAMDAPPLSSTPSEQKKERANITLLGSSNTSSDPQNNWVVFRVAVPYKKANIKAVIIKNGSYNEKVDFEEISEVRDGNATWLDDPVVGNLTLNVFPFNRYLSAFNRYNSIKTALASGHPAHTGNTYPIPNSGIYLTPAYVIDIKAKGLPQNFSNAAFEVYVVDLWGKGVKGTL